MLQPQVDPRLARRYRDQGLWGDASLHDFWALSVLACPDKEAVVDARGTRLTFAQVDRQASRVAGHLARAGVRAGDVVSVQLPNWAQFLVTDVACLKLGAVVNPILPSHRLTELRYRLTRCGSVALVAATRFRHQDYRPTTARLADELGLRAVLEVAHAGLPADEAHDLDLVAAHDDPLPADRLTPGRGTDVAAVLFTSGSEAQPKGALLSHDNLLAGERAFAYELGVGFADRMFMPAPLSHATGFLHGLTMPYLVQATSVLLDVFTGPAAVAMMTAERVTCGMGATPILAETFDAAAAGDGLPTSLRFLCCGGSLVPRPLLERYAAAGVRLHSVYGSTESAPHTLTTAADTDQRVLTTDGRPVVGTEVKVVDPLTRTRRPVGVEGEEASRGPAVFLGYLGDPERTAAVVDSDGWYHSGDLAVLDADGYLRVTGRIKDTIVRGGENISATEVEALVRAWPGVKDVAVVAMPHPRLGETCCAFVVPAPGAEPVTVDDLHEMFVAQQVAKCKIPERVEIVDELPMTATGKVRKAELRELIAARLAAEQAAGASGAADGTGETRCRTSHEEGSRR